MRIASWNVNSLKVRLPHLGQWCADGTPDILALQETKVEDGKFPCEAIETLGYRTVFNGQRTYNGVAILARQPIEDAVIDIDGFHDEQRRFLAATVGDLRIVNLYVVNGQSVGSEKYAYKLRWLEAVTAALAQEIRRYPRMIVLGDFNIAPDDRDVHDPEAWREQVLCSTPEREALRRLMDLGLHDSYRMHTEEGGTFSWWDYRQAAFRRNMGLRIDLVLVSDALRGEVTGAGIDREPRAWERPSDHAPVWVELGGAAP